MSPANETEPGFSFSDSSKLKAPAKVWLAIILGVASGVAAWTATRGTVEEHAQRLKDHSAQISALEANERNSNALLIRIDERTAEIKRRLDQPNR